MTAVKHDSGTTPRCPRCGARLHRLRRRLLHRLVSVLYPVHLYGCSEGCGWLGLLPSVAKLRRRKRQVRALLVVTLVAAALGLVAWRYRADLHWHAPAPDPADGIEEVGAPQ